MPAQGIPISCIPAVTETVIQHKHIYKYIYTYPAPHSHMDNMRTHALTGACVHAPCTRLWLWCSVQVMDRRDGNGDRYCGSIHPFTSTPCRYSHNKRCQLRQSAELTAMGVMQPCNCTAAVSGLAAVLCCAVLATPYCTLRHRLPYLDMHQATCTGH